METFVVTGTVHQLGTRKAANESAYYRAHDVGSRRLPFSSLVSAAAILVGAVLTLGLSH